jgi:opacity protein-like surface antigen
MRFKYLLACGALATGLAAAAAAAASADNVIGTEDSTTGFVGNFLESAFPGTQSIVASDGEASFDPFGAGYDTSDGLNFSAVGFTWTQAADSTWNDLGNQTWVLPAVIPGCGAENSTTCEPVGHFISSATWSPGAIGTWLIYESDGSLSDRIVTFNTVNGAELKFYSDPSIPEPATWAILLLGVFGVGGALRIRRHGGMVPVS